ncbi:MAG: hypothetical protein LAO56_07485 [Acidobacteriia bacterium]|nr:hypothetical protein [Terriglobia bacterium]
MALVLTSFSCLAQKQTPASTSNAVVIQKNNILVPAGTRIALVLTHPIQSRYIHRGDDIYAQITFPVTSGNEALIPPGTFIQGKVDKLERKGRRGELHLQSASITFPNGYVAPITTPLTMESDDGYAIKDPGKGRSISAFTFPMAGAGLGALIGHSVASSQPSTITSTIPPGCTGPPPGCLTSSLTVPPDKGKSTVIGSAVGGAIGTVASLVMLTVSRHFYLDVGSPVDMVLQQPLSLERDQVSDAITQSQTHPVQAIAQRPQPPTPPSTSTSPFDCPTGEEYCHGSCVNTASFINDSNNCGRCGNHCSFSEACTGGSCSCGPGYTSCMGSCVSSSSFIRDSSNCGRCGNHCSIGESCMGGSCTRTAPCRPGDITCH